MNPQLTVALAIRLLALFVGFYSMRFLIAIPASLSSSNLADSIYLSYAIGGLALLLTLFLWFFPMTIAHRIIPRTNLEGLHTLRAFEAAQVGCSLIGLWFAVSVLPTFIWFCFSHFINSGDQSFFRHLSAVERQEFAFYLIELAIAVALIFKSNVFARWVVSTSDEKEKTGDIL